ncbi:LysR family transcriptional regulator [Cognatishimia activa]|uniref:HTH-type transcriptional regulator YofA n=1 Tax=Cognatishimia activa TaxID=1715691 RepID=A0A0P1IXZ2_9RHOB|nr:LysR family transcriptional regulator [Cognatishimia activa]CUI77690.1 HTH-type transcriptional regulator YofA [Cognatishimia activa]CUK26787.1 HTH-type transcriptional regulator YofA [Cognatishimia activa]
MRNLDVTTLRSFMAVADLGGVTKAAGFLNLTQSAVSMQLKRLEELLGLDLFDRTGRRIALTASGEQLLGYARRMVALNDEAVRRLTDQEFEGEVTIGIPHDILYPSIPNVLKKMRATYPRLKVNVVNENTHQLLPNFEKGMYDLILTTEPTQSGDTLCALPLVWIGSPGGACWRRRPLQIAQSRNCSFRPRMIGVLDEQGVDWESAVDTGSDRSIEVTVAADLAVSAMIEGTEPAQLEVIDHGGTLPDIGMQYINMYGGEAVKGEGVTAMADLVRQAFREMGAQAKAHAVTHLKSAS